MLSKLTQEDTENLNKLVILKSLNHSSGFCLLSALPETQGPDGFADTFYKSFNKPIIPIIYKLLGSVVQREATTQPIL